MLGLNGQAETRKLVRALLADPLSAEAEWEDVLEKADGDSRTLLIR